LTEGRFGGSIFLDFAVLTLGGGSSFFGGSGLTLVAIGTIFANSSSSRLSSLGSESEPSSPLSSSSPAVRAMSFLLPASS